MTTLYCTRSDCPKVAAKSSTSNLTPSCSLESIDAVPHFTFEEDCHSVSCLDDFTPLKLQDVPQENLVSSHLQFRNQVSAAFRATMNQQDHVSSPAADEYANVNSVTIDNRSENELVRSQHSSDQTEAPSSGRFFAQFHGELVVNKQSAEDNVALPSAAELVLHVQDLDLFAPSPPKKEAEVSSSHAASARSSPPASTKSDGSDKNALLFSSMQTIRRSQERQQSRFPQHGDLWKTRFRELCHYKQLHGDCLVPHNYSDNLPLARWVKRQRYQFRRLREGQASTMTPERRQSLEDIGFVWDFHGDIWEERIAELKAFKAEHSHCNVPCPYPENPGLGIWTKCQRRQKRLLDEGKPSSMTQARIEELDAIGFTWGLRSYRKRKSPHS